MPSPHNRWVWGHFPALSPNPAQTAPGAQSHSPDGSTDGFMPQPHGRLPETKLVSRLPPQCCPRRAVTPPDPQGGRPGAFCFIPFLVFPAAEKRSAPASRRAPRFVAAPFTGTAGGAPPPRPRLGARSHRVAAGTGPRGAAELRPGSGRRDAGPPLCPAALSRSIPAARGTLLNFRGPRFPSPGKGRSGAPRAAGPPPLAAHRGTWQGAEQAAGGGEAEQGAPRPLHAGPIRAASAGGTGAGLGRGGRHVGAAPGTAARGGGRRHSQRPRPVRSPLGPRHPPCGPSLPRAFSVLVPPAPSLSISQSGPASFLAHPELPIPLHRGMGATQSGIALEPFAALGCPEL